MGFETQPTSWQCGPFALKHALLALGIVADARELTEVSGATEDGADEQDLARAARRFGCTLALDRRPDPATARQALDARLRAHTPVLLCVDQWSHWVTAVGVDGDTVVLLDSREAGVFLTVPWPALRERLAYRPGRGQALFDLHPLLPAGPVARARFSLPRVDFLRRAEHRDLGREWGTYLRALLTVSRPPGAQTEWTLAVGDLLRESAAAVLAGLPTRATLRAHRRLSHAAFVADTHSLETAPDAADAVHRVARRIGDLTAAA